MPLAPISPDRSSREPVADAAKQPHVAAPPASQSRDPAFRCAFCCSQEQKAHRKGVRPPWGGIWTRIAAAGWAIRCRALPLAGCCGRACASRLTPAPPG
jgi:hypothetical protein